MMQINLPIPDLSNSMKWLYDILGWVQSLDTWTFVGIMLGIFAGGFAVWAIVKGLQANI